ncbi:potassium channel family protein [candidate division CSSED10-310 bacterium]|uniref:Potassium channel family protein n=1 Tax=candidate division CSSED10-310 bacterium TaxID=2855610 RepID=A0ABV6YRL8_UNCC1
MSSYIRHFEIALMFLFVILILGTLGYHILEGWTLTDSLYMTTITISTVGYGETHPMGIHTRIFTIVLILASICVVGYLLGSLTQILIVGEIATLLGRRRLESKIKKLKNHIIVCGCGRVGSVIVNELQHRKMPFIVIESAKEVLEKINQNDVLVLEKNAVEDEVLIEAGIQQARGLVTTLPSDPDNVFITLSARALNKNIFILSRASQETSVNKLISAGANKVVLPYRLGASRMVYLLTKPTVIDFLDFVMHKREMPLDFEEISVAQNSPYSDQTLGSSGIRQEFDVIIVAIKKKDGEMIFNPNVDTFIEPGDVLVTLGYRESLLRFSQKAQHHGGRTE